jgi:ATP-binding cassette, subfamily B, bacterial PglK
MIKYFSLMDPYYKKWIYFFTVCAFINVILDTLSIVMVLPLVNILFDVKESTGFMLLLLNWINNFFSYFGINADKDIKVLFLISFVLLFVLKNFFQIFFIYFQNILFSSIEANIGIRIIKRTLGRTVISNNEKSIAEVIRDSSSQASIFIQNFLVPIVHTVIEIVTFGLIVSFIGFNYFNETVLISVLLLSIVSFQYFLIRKKIFTISSNIEMANKQKIKSIIDSSDIFKEIKIFNLYQYFFREFSKQAYRIMKMQNALGMIRFILKPIIEILFVSGICFSMYTLLISGQGLSESLPKLTLIVMAAFRVVPSINRLNIMTQRLRSAKPVLINLYIQLKDYNFEKIHSKVKKLDLKSKIKIKNLYFQYPGKNEPLFKNINLELKKGNSYLLLGDSGVGKSTFVELVLGLLQPTAGSILADNKNVKNNLLGWHKSFSYVPQKANLIQDTLLNNIILFSEDRDAAKLKYIINLMQLQNLINKNKEVGQRGSKISGGQVQRVAMARALLKESNILVIDEGTAALDNENEIGIIKKIIAYKKDNVILFISHKKSLKKYFDYSLEFNKQRIKKTKNGN